MLVRFLTRDDPIQAAQARAFFSSVGARHGAYISLLVLAETAWTLARSYRLGRAEIGDKIEEILNVAVFEIERPDIAQQALIVFRESRADFGDCCISVLAQAAGCEYTYTFDKAAAKLPGMRLLGASEA